MTGWRLGWLISPPGFSNELEKLTETQTSGAATFVQRAGIAAVRDGEPYIRSLVTEFTAARDRVSQFLRGMPGVRYVPPAAGFYAFFAIEGESDGMALARRIIDEARVGLAPGTAFGPGAPDHVRLCFASSAATLETALGRLEQTFFRNDRG
jgi:aspartate/methionine/tyrosine aminotransferase